jgi:Leucine-rich repeat (LRR) protein
MQSSENNFIKTDEMRKYNTLFNLRISRKNYSTIPANVFKGIRIKALAMTTCQIQSIDKNAFNGILALSELDINRNRLKYLTELNAALSQLNESVLPGFNKLNLERNLIEDVADEFPQTLRYLTELNLNANKITLISSSTFKNLVSLRVLRLSANPILRFENNCFQFQTNLLGLYMDNNDKLLQLVNGNLFNGLTKLDVLSITETTLASLVNMTWSNMPNLNRLSLNTKRIKKFQMRNDLNNMVRTLNLNGNKIQHLIENMFVSFVNLEELNLQYNEIRFVSSNTFTGLLKLINLKLYV